MEISAWARRCSRRRRMMWCEEAVDAHLWNWFLFRVAFCAIIKTLRVNISSIQTYKSQFDVQFAAEIWIFNLCSFASDFFVYVWIFFCVSNSHFCCVKLAQNWNVFVRLFSSFSCRPKNHLQCELSSLRIYFVYCCVQLIFHSLSFPHVNRTCWLGANIEKLCCMYRAKSSRASSLFSTRIFRCQQIINFLTCSFQSFFLKLLW